MRKVFQKAVVSVLVGLILATSQSSEALEMDWGGQFWSEYHFVRAYSTDTGGSTDPRANSGGYYVPSGGRPDATFQTLFLRLRPKAIVNDNISIKTEWWLLDPIFGLYGSGLPYTIDQTQYYSNQARGASVTAQRFWGEFISDFGTFQVGRVPLHWGLGLIWNGGDNLWDRYMSSGDGVRWIAKFGSFTVAPSFLVQTMGNSITGTTGVSDYSLILKYDNQEDDFEVGVNLLKRMGGDNQAQNAPGVVLSPGGAAASTVGMNYFFYDIFAKKRFRQLTLGVEIPVGSGSVSNVPYSGFGLASEVDWKPSDSFGLLFKAGYASGQSGSSTANLSNVNLFSFNPNYKIGMIMFNYQLNNFYGNQTVNNPGTAANSLSSPYDNPVVNAVYTALSAQIKPSDKWTLRPALLYAFAPTTARSSEAYFYNYWTRTTQAYGQGANAQGSSLGIEADFGISFQWDEYFNFAFDTGLYFPGSFYAFSNLPADNPVHPIFATAFRVGVNF